MDRSDLAQGLPRLSLSVRPRRSGQRGHGAFSGHRRLGDHPPSESPRPKQRRRRPAIEEVGQIWAGPQPGEGARLMPSVHFVVSLGAGPARLPSSPRPPNFATPICPPHTAPLPASAAIPQVLLAGKASPLPRLPQPPDPRAASAAPSDRAGQVRRCPHCSVRLASGHRNPSFRPRTLPSAPRFQGALSSSGQLWAPAPGIRPGSAGNRKERGGGEEGAGAGWAAGGIPGSAQTGPGAARCEMRHGAAGTAGRGRQQNLPRILRASRRSPPAARRWLRLPCHLRVATATGPPWPPPLAILS